MVVTVVGDPLPVVAVAAVVVVVRLSEGEPTGAAEQHQGQHAGTDPGPTPARSLGGESRAPSGLGYRRDRLVTASTRRILDIGRLRRSFLAVGVVGRLRGVRFSDGIRRLLDRGCVCVFRR
jgi:hypothetical protein